MKSIKVYIAGKVSKESVFGTHHWRDEFCKTVSDLSKRELISLDPLAAQRGILDPNEIFNKDVKLINKCDLVIVYLSDDISVGGSQEIVIAKYLKKPVIGFAPYGGKFNGSQKEMLGLTIKNYKDPFVFSTCDMVCGTIEEVADAVKEFEKINIKTLSIIDEALQK